MNLHDLALFFSGVIFMFLFSIMTRRTVMNAIFGQFLEAVEMLAFNTAIGFMQNKAQEVNGAIKKGINRAAQQAHDDYMPPVAIQASGTASATQA